jgi:hypothetical protein
VSRLSVSPVPLFRLGWLLLLAAVPLHAGVAGTIAGVVTDATSGEPLVGANVVVVETRQGHTASTTSAPVRTASKRP